MRILAALVLASILTSCATSHPSAKIASRLKHWPDACVVTCGDDSAKVVHDGKVYVVAYRNNWLTGFEIQSICLEGSK